MAETIQEQIARGQALVDKYTNASQKARATAPVRPAPGAASAVDPIQAAIDKGDLADAQMQMNRKKLAEYDSFIGKKMGGLVRKGMGIAKRGGGKGAMK